MYREGTCVRVYSTQNQTSTTLFKRKINEKYTFGIYIFIYVLLINAKSPLLDYICTTGYPTRLSTFRKVFLSYMYVHGAYIPSVHF